MSRWVAAALLLFAVGGAVEAYSQQCNIPTAPINQVFWDDGSAFITVFVPPELVQGFDSAANNWNSACGGSNGPGKNALPFRIEAGASRPQGFTPSNSIVVEFMPGPIQTPDGQFRLGEWVANGSIIRFARNNHNGVPFDFTATALVPYFMHELGHALGLADPPTTMSCGSSGVMNLPPTSEINDEHCEVVRNVQEPTCNMSHQLTGNPVALGVRPGGGCPAGCECPDADTPDGFDEILGFCDRFPESCPGGDDPWWDDNSFLFETGIECTVVTATFEGGGSTTWVDCRTIYYYGRSGGPGTTARVKPATSESDLEGYGPDIRMDTITEGMAVQGRIEVKGSAVSPDGVGNIGVWIDNQPVTLENWITGQPWGSCTHNKGGTDPDCPNVGFSGWLDTATLTPGPHELQIVAIDRRNPNPRPGIASHTIIVGHACGDTTRPTATLTAPLAGATLSGTVPITVDATDDVAVKKVQFYADDVLIGEDRKAPWSMQWDTRRVGNGGHALSTRAVDGCDNYRYSSTIGVTVENIEHSPKARNDRAATNVGIGITINPLRNDSDPDGDTIVLDANAIVDAPKHGTATRESDTTIRYVPAAGFAGNDAFRYRIHDGTGHTDTAWVAVEVSGVNHKPVANDDSASGHANTALTIDVVANDTDADGDLLSLVGTAITAPPMHGRAERVSRTSVLYLPHAGFTGNDRFQYEIGDGKGRRARAWVEVTVTEGNHPPVAVSDAATTAGNAAVTIDVTANDSDPDGDLVLLIGSPIVVAPAHGTAAKASGSSIVYTPASGYIGTDTFQYEIGDGNGRRARATVTITVTAFNRDPVAEADSVTILANTPATINVLANDSDPDGDVLSLSAIAIVAAPAHGSAVKIDSTSITYTPATGYSGTDAFTYEINDGRGLTARAVVSITINSTGGGNRNPVAVDDLVSVRRDTSIDVNVTANDSDPDGDPVTLITSPVIVQPAHGTATKLSGSTIRYTPAAAWVGTDTFQYEIGDGNGKRARAWVRITVRDANNRPIAQSDTARVAPGGQIIIDVTANDSDPDGDPIVIVSNTPIVTAPAHGTATKSSASTIRYVPAAGYSGTDRFQYEIGDGNGARARAWVDVSVTYDALFAAMETSNMSPHAINDLVASNVGETTLGVLANDDDDDRDYLALTVQPIITAPLSGTVRRVSDTAVAYTPNPGFTGNDSFEYEMADPNGVTSRAWVAVNVPYENEAPSAVDDTLTVIAGREAIVDVVQNDADGNVDDLKLTQVAIAAWPQSGTVRRFSDREIVYSPAAGFLGTDSFQYEITDERGQTARATVHVTVTDQNAEPLARADVFTTNAGVPVSLPVLANDFDPNGDALRVVSSSQPSNGDVTWDPDPAAPGLYTPQPGFSGTDTFTYTISDASGLESTATVTITVVLPNRPPVVAADSATTKTRTAVLIGVLANDYDPDYPTKLRVTSVTTPPHGTATINWNGESVTYTPASDFAGVDTFTYTVSDSVNAVSGTVTVTVPNAAPLPHSDVLAAPEDTWVGYNAWNVLNNDVDPDGDELHIISIEQPAHGQFLIAPDKSQFSYQSNANWFGMDTFYYTVSDPFGASVRVMAQIGVSSVNDAPVAVNDSFSVYKNQVLTLTQAQIVANDTDVEGHTISVYSVGAPTNGTAQKLADGNIEYRPYGEFVGTDSFEYTIEDSGGGAYGTGRITVTVMQDTPPVADFTFSCTNLVCSFDASSSTDDRGVVLYQWIMGNNSAASGKSFSYTYGAVGTYQVRLTVQDALGQNGVITKTVTVTCPTPSISMQPASRATNYGQPTTLNVTATNATSYQWYQGASGSTITPVGTNSNSLTVTLYGNASYWVKVNNGCGSTNSATATVTVCTPPSITTQPQSKSIMTGTSTTLSVVAGGSGPFSYQWYEGPSGTTTTPVGFNSSSFTTPVFAAATTKSYWVRVTSACNSGVVNSATATITVSAAQIARRQFAGSTANSQLSITTNWTQPTQAGTLLVAIVSAERSWYPIANWQPPAGWQLAATYEMSHVKTSVYYYPNNPGGRTAENFGNGGYYDDMILQLGEYTGAAAAPLDKTALNGNTFNDGYVDTGSTAQTSQPKELVITALTSYAQTDFFGPSQGFVELDDRNQGFGNLTAAVHEKIVTTAGSWGHSAQTSSPSEWIGLVVTFKAAN